MLQLKQRADPKNTGRPERLGSLLLFASTVYCWFYASGRGGRTTRSASVRRCVRCRVLLVLRRRSQRPHNDKDLRTALCALPCIAGFTPAVAAAAQREQPPYDVVCVAVYCWFYTGGRGGRATKRTSVRRCVRCGVLRVLHLRSRRPHNEDDLHTTFCANPCIAGFTWGSMFSGNFCPSFPGILGVLFQDFLPFQFWFVGFSVFRLFVFLAFLFMVLLVQPGPPSAHAKP